MQLCDFEVGIDKPFFLIAGPCVIESEQLSLDVAGKLQELTSQLSIPFIFKVGRKAALILSNTIDIPNLTAPA